MPAAAKRENTCFFAPIAIIGAKLASTFPWRANVCLKRTFSFTACMNLQNRATLTGGAVSHYIINQTYFFVLKRKRRENIK